MARLAYVNGRYLPLAEAVIPVEDRGNQFADGVYEVVKRVRGRLIDWDQHCRRLVRSCEAIGVELPLTLKGLRAVADHLLRQNRLGEALLYIQVSRGVATRDHAFPKDTKPSIVMTVRRPRWASPRERQSGVGVVTQRDERWGRCDIKSIALLANVLAKQAAVQSQAKEAWLVTGDGMVREGSSSNAYIVDKKGRVITHPADNHILAGVTRAALLRTLIEDGIDVVEEPFHIEAAQNAVEAFMTSTSSWVLPVVSLDRHPVGVGEVGPITRRAMDLYNAHVASLTAA
ncbi:MAG: D-amino-acid transaminase [Geminicoccaceae bacterium]